MPRLLSTLHDLLRAALPSRPLPFRVQGGYVYLDLKDSPKALERLLGFYEIHKRKAMAKFLRPGMTFVDVGAAKGDFSVLAAQLVGPTGHVIAIEPHPANCRWLQRSIELSAYHTVTVSQVALSSTDGTGLLYLSGRSEWHSLLPGQLNRDEGTLEVTIRSMDSLMIELELAGVDVMKIDAEGAEQEVLQGAERTLASNPQLVIFMDLHPKMVRPATVLSWLHDHGLEAYCMTPPHMRLASAESNLKELIATRNPETLEALRNERCSFESSLNLYSQGAERR